MAVLIGSAGVLLRWDVSRNLDEVVNQNLQARVADVRSLISSDESAQLTSRGESLAQVLTPTGVIYRGTPGDTSRSLLTTTQLAAAGRGPLVVDRVWVPGEEQPVRLLAEAFRTQDGAAFVAVVGLSLEIRDGTISNLNLLLLLGGPIGLLIASGAGYLLASAALRPVEAMRARATRISGVQAGERLPVPPARDEVRRLGETLNEMLARIDRTLERERAFVSDASHELRTPLAILKSELEVAGRPMRTTGEMREAIASAAEETDRLVELAEQLLVIARLEDGKLPVHRAPLETLMILKGIADRFTSRFAAAGRELRIASPPGLMIDADELRLEQAIGNLLENALRHADGTVNLTADASAPGIVRISVRDHGNGVPPAFLKEAFERFSRADTGRTRGGSGLGLAIVQAIAQAHHGARWNREPPR